MRNVQLVVSLVVLVLVAGCSSGEDSPGSDGGGSDAATGSDAGGVDAGEADGGGSDAGEADAGEADGGGSDAGGVDAGEADGGSSDAGEADAGEADGGGSDSGPDPDAGCTPPPCAAPPPGCHYEGSDPCTCGTLVCEGSCGGVLGAICSAAEWCDYPEHDACGDAGSTGTCVPIPSACADVYMPVCGCDGVTYGNECEAHAAGTDVAAEGDCGCTADRDCGPGEYCAECRGVGGVTHVCLHRGTVC